MKCPHCGRDLDEGSRICPYCSAALPQPDNDRPPDNDRQTGNNKPDSDPYAGYAVPPVPPAPVGENRPGRGKAAAKAVLAVLLYAFLFFAIQACVTGTFIGANLDLTGAAYAAQSGDEEAFSANLNQAIETVTDLVFERQALLLLVSSLTAILILCLHFRLRRKKPVEELALYPVSPLRLIQFALFGVALIGAIFVLLSLLPLPEALYAVQENQYAALYEGSLLMNLLSVGIAGPVTEELFFRGIPMTRLEPVLGGGGAVVLSALLFGLVHGTPIAIGYAFLVGMVLALIYRKYRTILPGIVCHCFFNMSSYWIRMSSYWIRESWEGAAVAILGVVSVLILIFTWHTAVIRYPSFTDVVWDTAGRIRVDDPARAAIIAECRAVRESGQLNAETLERLSAAWDEASGKGGDDHGDGGQAS